MDRAYNFNAEPSAMPLEVLKEAQAEFLDFSEHGHERDGDRSSQCGIFGAASESERSSGS